MRRDLIIYDFVASLNSYYFTVLIIPINTIETHRSKHSPSSPSSSRHTTYSHLQIFKLTKHPNQMSRLTVVCSPTTPGRPYNYKSYYEIEFAQVNSFMDLEAKTERVIFNSRRLFQMKPNHQSQLLISRTYQPSVNGTI